jgi:hypothetical protein
MVCPFHKHQRFNFSFLGAFEKLPKATISFIMYVYLSILMEQFGSHWTDFHEI